MDKTIRNRLRRGTLLIYEEYPGNISFISISNLSKTQLNLLRNYNGGTISPEDWDDCQNFLELIGSVDRPGIYGEATVEVLDPKKPIKASNFDEIIFKKHNYLPPLKTK